MKLGSGLVGAPKLYQKRAHIYCVERDVIPRLCTLQLRCTGNGEPRRGSRGLIYLGQAARLHAPCPAAHVRKNALCPAARVRKLFHLGFDRRGMV